MTFAAHAMEQAGALPPRQHPAPERAFASIGTGTRVDSIDFLILAHLQRAGRCSNVELADSVGLTPSPCLTRVKRLQDNGFISSYRAQLELAKLGDVLTVFAEITLSKHRRRDLRRFEDAVRECPEVMECYRVSGG